MRNINTLRNLLVVFFILCAFMMQAFCSETIELEEGQAYVVTKNIARQVRKAVRCAAFGNNPLHLWQYVYELAEKMVQGDKSINLAGVVQVDRENIIFYDSSLPVKTNAVKIASAAASWFEASGEFLSAAEKYCRAGEWSSQDDESFQLFFMSAAENYVRVKEYDKALNAIKKAANAVLLFGHRQHTMGQLFEIADFCLIQSDKFEFQNEVFAKQFYDLYKKLEDYRLISMTDFLVSQRLDANQYFAGNSAACWAMLRLF